ncbi:MAG: hypothetical protein JO001_15485 [Alphaproteobacteria bacterium]|nr:hypothetical protein [Alphaproteobacteria bacterium]
MFGLFANKRRKTFERVINRANRSREPVEASLPENVPYLLGIWDGLTPTQRRACLTGEPVPPTPPVHEDVTDDIRRISVPGGWIYFKKSDEAPFFVASVTTARER